MKLNNILAALAAGVLLVSGASCTDEVKYDPAEPEKGNQVFFDSNDPTEIAIPLDATQVEVTVHRVKTDAAATVDLSSAVAAGKEVITEGVFSVPSQVTFAAGQATAQIVIPVDFSLVLPATPYYLTIELESEKTPYGLKEQTFQLSYEPWSEWTRLPEEGTVQMGGVWDYNYDEYIYYRKSLVNDNIEQYAASFPFSNYDESYICTVYKNRPLKIDGEDAYFMTCNHVVTPAPSNDGGYFEWYDCYLYTCIVNGVDEDPNNDRIYGLVMDLFAKNGTLCSYYIPSKGFLYMSTYITATGIELGYGYGTFGQTIQLGGFTVPQVTFSKVYNIVNEFGDEEVVIQALKNDDVYAYSYTVMPGSLSEAQVETAAQAIIGDEEALRYNENERYFAYNPEAGEGVYTVVVVGFDSNDDVILTDSYNFTFESVKSYNPWKPAGTAVYTDGFLYPWYGNNFGGETWTVNIERNEEDPALIRMVDAYQYPYWPIVPTDDFNLPGHHYMTLNIGDPDGVYMLQGSTGIELNPQDGAIETWSLADLYLQRYDLEILKNAGYCGTLRDNVITFPGASLLIQWANDPGWSYTNFDLDIPVTVMGPDGEQMNLAGQLEGLGWFELDLSGSSVASVAAKKANKTKGQLSVDLQRALRSPAYRIPATKKNNDVTSTVKKNLKEGKLVQFDGKL